ncbi:MAG: hypothetical protein AB7Q27_27225 [Acidimicrobiia bacterium]
MTSIALRIMPSIAAAVRVNGGLPCENTNHYSAAQSSAGGPGAAWPALLMSHPGLAALAAEGRRGVSSTGRAGEVAAELGISLGHLRRVPPP